MVQSHNCCMSVRYGYTTDINSLAAAAIRSATDGDYSHVVVIFHDMYYYESIWKMENGKTGVRGPIPLKNLLLWAEKSPQHVLKLQEPLKLNAAEVAKAEKIARESAVNIKYAPIQLLRNELYLRLGLRLKFGRKASTKRFTCSEFAARILPPRLWPNLEIGDVLWDDIVPSGSRGIGLYERMEFLLNGN